MRNICTLLLIGTLFCNGAHAADISSLLAPYPAKNQKELSIANADFVAGGEQAIHAACSMLVAYKPQEDIKVRYALNGVARYVARPNAEQERLMFASALCKTLPTLTSKPVQRFVIDTASHRGLLSR